MYFPVLDRKNKRKEKQVCTAVEVVCFYCICMQHALSVGQQWWEWHLLQPEFLPHNFDKRRTFMEESDCLISALLHQHSPPPLLS